MGNIGCLKGSMIRAFDRLGTKVVALLAALTVFCAPVMCVHACMMTDGTHVNAGTSDRSYECSCCAKCRVMSSAKSNRPSAANGGCTCGQNSSELPPALPADPSQDRINLTRPSASVMSAPAVFTDACVFGGLSVNLAPCKPAAEHVLCCVWRC
jgi:hypothetical protein